jgi:hypothetical protein
MTPAELREAVAYLGLYQHELARRLQISPSHFRKLLSGRHPIQGPTEVAILGMIELKSITGVTPDLADIGIAAPRAIARSKV